MTQPTRTGRKDSSPADTVRTLGFEVIDWMESCLVHTEGQWRGEPFRLLHWQKRLLLELFRLVSDEEWDPVPGQPLQFRRGLRRRYRQAFITIPKKNGKTELAAAIALYLLIGDNEPSPKGVFVAGSLKQAGLSFRAAQTMILESPVLSQLVGQRNVGDLVIEVPSIPGSRLERVAAEAGTNDGPSLHFGVLDEVHEYKGEQGKKVHGVTTNAGAARKNPLFVSISTVGEDEEDEEQVWVDLYRRGAAVEQEPEKDSTFFFYRVQAAPASDWQDRAVWEAANPSANVTVSWSFYQSEWAKGERWCRRYYLNQPTGGSEAPWMDPDAWDACAAEVRLSGKAPAYASVRVARDGRVAAVAVAQKLGSRVLVQVRIFEAEDLEDGDPLDFAEVEEHVLELCRMVPARIVADVIYHPGGRVRHPLKPGPEVSYHSSFFERSRQLLEGQGVTMVHRPDSQQLLVPAAQLVLDLVRDGSLVHDGDADLARHMGHVVGKEVRLGATIAIMPASPPGRRRRIEGALAVIHAVARATDPRIRPPGRGMRLT